MLVLLGEVGGIEEYTVCDLLKSKRITKPLIAWCIGTCSDRFATDVQFGHAGASASGERETARAKNAALKEAGAVVPENFDLFGDRIGAVYKQLLQSGIILPTREVPPPPVPMDYAWARVSIKIKGRAAVWVGDFHYTQQIRCQINIYIHLLLGGWFDSTACRIRYLDDR